MQLQLSSYCSKSSPSRKLVVVNRSDIAFPRAVWIDLVGPINFPLEIPAKPISAVTSQPGTYGLVAIAVEPANARD